MAYALQQLVNGITLGLIYGLIAIGYTMVYGIIGMINFAHGDVFMIGAFIGIIFLTALSGITSVPLGLLVALILSAALCALYGFSSRARRLSAAARLVPPGAADLRHRHVDRAGELCADQPGGAGSAASRLIQGGITLIASRAGFSRSARADRHRRADRSSLMAGFTY